LVIWMGPLIGAPFSVYTERSRVDVFNSGLAQARAGLDSCNPKGSFLKLARLQGAGPSGLHAS